MKKYIMKFEEQKKSLFVHKNFILPSDKFFWKTLKNRSSFLKIQLQLSIKYFNSKIDERFQENKNAIKVKKIKRKTCQLFEK